MRYGMLNEATCRSDKNPCRCDKHDMRRQRIRGPSGFVVLKWAVSKNGHYPRSL